jgi:hypothetical protein
MVPMESNFSKSRRMMLLQQKSSWDLSRDLNWDQFDISKPLFPLSNNFAEALQLTAQEQIALSQLIGIMAAQAISQHERVMQTAKESCWTKPAIQRAMDPDLKELGEEFFQEESKHADAFAQYVCRFADAKGLKSQDLQAYLPTYDEDSILARLMKLNSKLGGRAIWWLVMLTEEESVSIFKLLRRESANIEPVYLNLHRLHYEEEIRHMSYAPMMLRFFSKSASWMAKLVSTFDFAFMYLAHATWVLLQFLRVKRLKSYSGSNAFLCDLQSVFRKIDAIPRASLFKLSMTELPWMSRLLSPLEHQSIRAEWHRSKGFGHRFAFALRGFEAWMR